MKSICVSGHIDSIIRDVAKKLEKCSFIMYCTDDRRFHDISEKLFQALPDCKMIGTTGFMLTQNGSMAEGISAIGFEEDEAEVYVGALQEASTCPVKYLPELIEKVHSIDKKYREGICISFSTNNEEKIVSTMKISLENTNVCLLGGTAGNTTSGEQKKVAYNGKVLTDASVYAVIGSKIGKIKIVKENLYRPREKMHVVTKVSADNRTILEIDHRKAMDVYQEELGYTDATIEEGVFKNPLNLVVGNENYIAAIFSFNKDRSISTYKNIMKNDLICFTDIEENFKGFIENSIRNAIVGEKVEGIFSINCILRYLFFENCKYTSSYAELLNQCGNKNHFGIIGDGEQYIEQHINQSMVCAIFTKDR